ncbi:hypothetical protein GCM10023091_43360 [Ravibacter arvi]|uniref:Secretion system C-terminal sorting domain-containing protein n=1 Tax=Ravibacter arvi TaxID=2051041 RepID=A0ABP8MBE8_9BACT
MLLLFVGGKAAGQSYTIQVGTGTSTNVNVPINAYYGYSYTQQIYTAADIVASGGGTGSIRKIRFQLTGNTSVTNSSSIRVLMGNVSKENFAGNTDWVPVSGMTQVFNGVVEFPQSRPAWVEIALQSDFLWDGLNNIVIAVDENTPGYSVSNVEWGSTGSQDNRSIYYRGDSNNPDPASPPAAIGRQTAFPNVQFEFVQIPCSGASITSNTIASPSSLCGGGTVVLTPENKLRSYAGLQYQWESSPNGTTDWQPVNGANTYAHTASISTDTWFRAIVSCDASTFTTTPVLVKVYAIPDVSINFENIATCGGSATLNASGAATFEWTPAQGLDMTTGATIQASPTVPTTYTVTGTDGNNCRSTAKVTVSPLELYRPKISGTPESSCTAGTPVSITLSNPLENPDVKYELRDAADNVLVPWQNGASFTVTPNGEGVFTYRVIAKTPGCEALSQPGATRVYRSFDADVSTLEDCALSSGTIRIGNARGAAVKEEAWSNTFSDPQLPSTVTLFGATSITDGRAVITPSTTSQKGGIQLSGTTTFNPTTIRLAFKLTADQPLNIFGTGGADGLAWSFGDDADYTSAISNGAGSKLRLVFDAANNGSSNNNAQGIYLTYGYTSNNQMGPASAGTIAYNADVQSWKLRTDTPVLVVIDEDNRLTLTVNEQTIFDRVQLPAEYAAADKSQWKHLFTAFTGGDALRQGISDLAITLNSPDFVYGISAGDSGTLPDSWQASGTFADLASPAGYDVWIAAADNPAGCHKLLGTTRLLSPIHVSSVSKTDATGCVSNNGTITLSGLLAHAVYQVDYISSISGSSSTSQTANASGNIILTGLSPAIYSDIFVSSGDCKSAAVDPVTIMRQAPAITGASASAHSSCNGADGVIQLTGTFAAGAVSVSYKKNGIPALTTVAAAEGTLNLTGLSTGVYNSFSFTSGCGPSNVWADAVVIAHTGIPAPASGSALGTNAQGAGVTVDYYDSNCGLIATLNSSDGDPGTVSVSVTVAGSTGLFANAPYIGRYYDIQTVNPVGGTVTLYFTDAEITQYNSQVTTLGNALFPLIGSNGENLRITAYHSVATGPGPEGYDRTQGELILPSAIIHHPSGYWQVTFVTDGFSGFFAHTNQNDSPLPVALTSLVAVNEGSVNQVEWSTTEETPADRFVVERSADGRKFSTISVVQAMGTPGYVYRVSDELPFPGVNYYRLKVENSDGTGFYSKIVTAKYDSKTREITIGPNPVSDVLTVRLTEKVIGTATLRLIDLTGRVVAEKPVGKESAVQFSVHHLQPGVYIVQFLNTHFIRNVKVVKE